MVSFSAGLLQGCLSRRWCFSNLLSGWRTFNGSTSELPLSVSRLIAALMLPAKMSGVQIGPAAPV